jgi:hypothetical protein
MISVRIRNVLGPIAVIAAVLALLPTLLFNHCRRLVGPGNVFTTDRVEQMHAIRPFIMSDIQSAVDEIVRLEPATLAFWVGGDEWEYPCERLILDRMRDPPWFTSFNLWAADRLAAQIRAGDVVLAMGNNASRLTQPETGVSYGPVRQFGLYTLYVPKDQVRLVGADLSAMPFIGFDVIEGMADPEGPYPHWELPVVRWGLGPKTRLRVVGDGGPAALVLECRRNDLAEQAIAIFLNGHEIERFKFGFDFVFHRLDIPLHLLPGENELVFDYAVWQSPATPDRRAVQFRRIQVLPMDGPLGGVAGG